MRTWVERGISAVAFVVCFGVGIVDAQTCFGGAAISANAPLQASGSTSFSDGITRLTAGVAGGNESLFGGLNVLRISYEDVTGLIGFGATVGVQFTPDRERRISVCPMVSYSRASEEIVTQSEIMGGVMAGYTAVDTGTVRVIPTAGLTVGRIGFGYSDFDYSEGAAIGHLKFGLGVVMNERFALVPGLTVPFLSRGEDWAQRTALQFQAVISFGR